MKIVYKVFRVHPDTRLTSTNGIDGFTITYKLNEVNKPKIQNSKIFAFRSLERAKAYCRTFLYEGEYVVYKCLTSEYTNYSGCVVSPTYLNLEEAEFAWEYFNTQNDFHIFMDDVVVPSGTVFCNDIYLLNKV